MRVWSLRQVVGRTPIQEQGVLMETLREQFQRLHLIMVERHIHLTKNAIAWHLPTLERCIVRSKSLMEKRHDQAGIGFIWEFESDTS